MGAKRENDKSAPFNKHKTENMVNADIKIGNTTDRVFSMTPPPIPILPPHSMPER